MLQAETKGENRQQDRRTFFTVTYSTINQVNESSSMSSKQQLSRQVNVTPKPQLVQASWI